MEITIYRKSMNQLYTMGELRINGLHQTYTVEATELMLPAGHYLVRIVKHSARKQSICIFTPDGKRTPWCIKVDHSWIGSRKNRSVCIGQPLIPGAMYKGTPDYERITDRLMKCTARKEAITLFISEHGCIENHPIRHWLEPNTH